MNMKYLDKLKLFNIKHCKMQICMYKRSELQKNFKNKAYKVCTITFNSVNPNPRKSFRKENGLIIYTFNKKIPEEVQCWCNSYRRTKWTRRHEFKIWTRLIAFHIALIPLGK